MRKLFCVSCLPIILHFTSLSCPRLCSPAAAPRARPWCPTPCRWESPTGSRPGSPTACRPTGGGASERWPLLSRYYITSIIIINLSIAARDLEIHSVSGEYITFSSVSTIPSFSPNHIHILSSRRFILKKWPISINVLTFTISINHVLSI